MITDSVFLHFNSTKAEEGMNRWGSANFIVIWCYQWSKCFCKQLVDVTFASNAGTMFLVPYQ